MRGGGCLRTTPRWRVENVPGEWKPRFYMFSYQLCMCVCMVITYSKSMDQPDKVANPAREQLNRENEYFPVPVRA